MMLTDNGDTSQNTNIDQRWAYGIITGVAVFLFYPVLETYAYTDVYEFLYHARNDNFIHVFIQGGRPIYGLINKAMLSATSTVDQLAWLRIFGVAGLLTATFIFFFVLRQVWAGVNVALLCCLFFIFSPSASIAGVWVGAYQVGWGLAMSLGGGYLLTRAFDETATKKRWLLALPSVVLGLASLLTYQPTYTAFIIPLFLHFLKHSDYRKTIYSAGVYLSLYGVYYGIHHLLLKLTALPALERTGLTDDPIGKLRWFFRWVLRMVYRDNFIFYSDRAQNVIAWLFVALSLCAIYYVLRGRKYPAMALTLGIIVGFLFSAYVPNLVSSDNYVSYRTLSTLFLFKIVLVFVGLGELEKRFKATMVIAALFGLILLVNAWYNINKGFISIQADEFRLVRAEVHRLIPEMKEKRELVFIMPDFYFLTKTGRVSTVVSDEFGSLSTSRDWVPMPIVKQILREKGETILEKELNVIELSRSDSTTISQHKGSPVLDVEALFPALNK